MVFSHAIPLLAGVATPVNGPRDGGTAHVQPEGHAVSAVHSITVTSQWEVGSVLVVHMYGSVGSAASPASAGGGSPDVGGLVGEPVADAPLEALTGVPAPVVPLREDADPELPPLVGIATPPSTATATAASADAKPPEQDVVTSATHVKWSPQSAATLHGKLYVGTHVLTDVVEVVQDDPASTAGAGTVGQVVFGAHATLVAATAVHVSLE